MSDSEDEDVILDDIKALEAVLTQKQTSNLIKNVKPEDSLTAKLNLCEPSTSNNYEDSLEKIHLLEKSDDECNDDNYCDEDESELEDLTEPQAALNLNRKLISLLTTTQKKLQFLLKECRRRQTAIDRKIRQRTAEPLNTRTQLVIAGIPYFKDKQQFPAPKNYDAKLKASRGELQIIDLPYPLRWTLKDRNTLWEAIYRSLKETDSLETNHKFKDVKKIPDEMIENMKELVGPLGSREFDWMRIAATDFNGRHSASECRAMWNVFLHPDMNKGKWKKNEDSRLKLLAEEYNFENWDVVAGELGTNRSGYQCFIRFNTRFKNNMFSRYRAWSKEEDQKLTDTVNTLRTGNFIPWGEVAKLMGNRKKQQIYVRWNYSLAPNLKKGRFTEEENKLLLQGVAQFGFNFTKISAALLPHRNNAQLNDHYKTLMNEKKNDWSCDDDIKLVKLYEKLGNNWAAIAKQFSNKSRVQVRHRHGAIIRYLRKGMSIQTMPRWGKKSEESVDSLEQNFKKGTEVLEEMSKMVKNETPGNETENAKTASNIDSELRDYFKGIYKTASKRGRSRKFYTNEELRDKTQRLDLILNLLNADLDIPDDFDDELNLSEKDKQLLISLKFYPENENFKFDKRQKNIESVRRKMFGVFTQLSDADRFVPPLPFNGKSQTSKKTKFDGINYKPDGNKYQIQLTHRLVTPEIIVTLNGGWENEMEFENVEKIFLGECKNVKSNTFGSNYPSTSGLVDNRGGSSTEQSASFSETNSKKLTSCYPEVTIPPNYVTLLGFRGILLSKHILDAQVTEEDDYQQENCTVTAEGKEALDLFEKRLIKLFKFPIELSEIPPPLLHEVQNEHFTKLDDDNSTKKRKATEPISRHVVRRKTKVEKASRAEPSEAQ